MPDEAVEDMKVRDESAMVQAKLELDAAVETYTSVLQAGNRADIETAKIRLHRAVIGLWWRLRPAMIDEESDSWDSVDELEHWDADVIWQGTHPVTGRMVSLEDLSDVGNWLDRSTAQTRSRSGPKFGGETYQETVQLRLPGGAALRCAQLLTREFREFGWGANATSTARTEIDDDLMDEAHEWLEENTRGES